MVWSWLSSSDKKQGGAVEAVGFLRRAVAAAMGCFFGCFGVKSANSSLISTPVPVSPRNKKALSSLFLSDEDDSIQKIGEKPEELDARELKNQAKFLKACGTLPETPAEIRKASKKWEDISAANGEQIGAEFETGSGPLVDKPNSNTTDGNNTKIFSSSDNSSVSVGPFAPSAQHKIKSVHFDCESDKTPFSSNDSSSGTSSKHYGTENFPKPSPYPTPLKLTDEMQTPGTIFPAYLNDATQGKNARVRSQYVYSVVNPMESLYESKDLKDENSDTIKDFSAGEEEKDEGSLSSWFKPVSSNQSQQLSDENVHHGKNSGDRPIIGMVAAHWNEDETSRISPKWWDGNGIPNSTNKYKEDQKVSWHATPFEERLEKALSEETFIPQRKPVTVIRPVEFNETDECDTALSHLQSPAHLKSVVSF